MIESAGDHLLCLSSGSRPRYREDILRALALPAGAELVFRYDKRHIAAEVITSSSVSKLPGRAALIGYIDQASPAYHPFVIPCRDSRIVEFADHGETVTLALEVGDLAYAEDLDQFQQVARQSSDLPNWIDAKLVGKWFLSAPGLPYRSFNPNDQTAWHRITSQIAARSDFDKVDTFFQLLGLKELHSTRYRTLRDSKTWYELEGRSEYVFDLYHFHPTKEPANLCARLIAGRDDLVQAIAAVEARLDSRYDRKRFRFRTAGIARNEETYITLEIANKHNADTMMVFDIPITLKANVLNLAIRAISIGLFVALPSILGAVATDKLSWSLGAAMVVSGVLAGFASTLSLPKSI